MAASGWLVPRSCAALNAGKVVKVRHNAPMSRFRTLAVALVVAALLSGGLAFSVGRREARSFPVITRYDLPPRPGHCSARPLQLAVVGDLHVSADTVPPAAVARLVAAINALHPDYVLLVGDYLGDDWPRTRQGIAAALAPLAGLRPRVGTAAVLGNNDWIDGPGLVARQLTAANIHVLRNDAWVTPDAAFMGIEELISNTANPVLAQERYVAAVERGDRRPRALRFWLAHQPILFDRVPTTGTLLVAGHTHGGQILPAITLPVGRSLLRMLGITGWPAENYDRGFYQRGAERMLVTSGIGTSGPPLRLGVPPEIALVSVRPCPPLDVRSDFQRPGGGGDPAAGTIGTAVIGAPAR